MSDQLKSSIEIAMEKLKGVEKSLPELTEDQKKRIADIRRECEAKIAECKILIDDKERLGAEIIKHQEKREREIEKIYQESR